MVGWWVGGWVVDKTKMMQSHLQTEVGVEVSAELGKNDIKSKDLFTMRALKIKKYQTES